MQLRNFVRRHKWRLRPLKRVVLPLRNLKRAAVEVLRTPPRIKPTSEYAGPSLIARHEIHPAESVTSLTSDSSAALSESAWIFELRDIDFWARYGGSVVTRDNFLLSDLSPEVWGARNHPIFSSLSLPKKRSLGGRTAIAVTPEAPGNYYHWLIDLLPRVATLRAHDKQGSFDRLLINGGGAPYEKATLQALGVPADKIVYVDASDRFQIENAAVTSMDHASKVVAPWKIKILRRLRDSVPRAEGVGARRLYVSRKHAAVRRVENEPEFEKMLSDQGFTTVAPESQPWANQVRMFADAEVVLAPHGAALANIAFCKPGTLIAEINTAVGYRDFFLQLAASAGLRYRLLEARARIAGSATSFRAVENEDMIFDLDTLREFLRSL
jgi:hypothetical protein